MDNFRAEMRLKYNRGRKDGCPPGSKPCSGGGGCYDQIHFAESTSCGNLIGQFDLSSDIRVCPTWRRWPWRWWWRRFPRRRGEFWRWGISWWRVCRWRRLSRREQLQWRRIPWWKQLFLRVSRRRVQGWIWTRGRRLGAQI